MITTEQIKQLREKTGVSIAQCKKALEEANGDMDKAMEVLRANSAAIASKKGDRAFGAGAVASYIHSTGTIGTLVELVSETDFVSKNDEFRTLAKELAMHIAAAAPKTVKRENPEQVAEEVLVEQPFIMNPDVTVQTRIDQAIQKFGEKIEVSRFVRYSVLE